MFESMKPEDIKQQIKEQINSGIDTREGSFFDDLTGPVALQLYKMYESQKALEPMVFVDETSGGYIDRWANLYGIYRKEGQTATGMLTFSGTDGVAIPRGTVVAALSGQSYLTTEEAQVLEGKAQVGAKATNTGSVYNISGGSMQLIGGIPGITAVTAGPFSGGTDPETDAELVKRLYDYWQKPSTSGNVRDYERWAMETPGVGAVKVTPLENGPGTVGVLIAGPSRQPVDSEIVAQCSSIIEAVRPIGATVTVESAAALDITVSAVVILTGEAAVEAIQNAFSRDLEEYLQQIAFTQSAVSYNRVAQMLMNQKGVQDFTSLTLCGGQENVSVPDKSVPVLGEVSVNASV